MIKIQKVAPAGQQLTEEEISEILYKGLKNKFNSQRVLILIPDHTRTLPLPSLFRVLVEVLADSKQLDFMVALGTHPPLAEEKLNKLMSISSEQRSTVYKHIGIFNHTWKDSSALTTIGKFVEDEIREIAGNSWHESLPNQVPIRINKAVLEYDQIIILGPTFPHEVVGFSGGAKYLFPGISGPEMIDATHWLGALAGVVNTIGVKQTPVRDLIHLAAWQMDTPTTLIALIVEDDGLTGLFIGDLIDTWSAAADLSAHRHIQWVDRPFQRVLSCAPPMYDELWTAAKAMYKIEPAVKIGGEVVIYAPHLEDVSFVHGKYIKEVGYHILPYFLNDWERFKDTPLGVLAHSTHLCGSGVIDGKIERANVRVILASKIPAEECDRLNLGYLDPAKIVLEEWKDRESEGILFVPKAGEMLFRVRQ